MVAAPADVDISSAWLVAVAVAVIPGSPSECGAWQVRCGGWTDRKTAEKGNERNERKTREKE